MKHNVAMIWQRFGPYHLARLRGGADALAQIDLAVIGLEVAGTDEYAWKEVSECGGDGVSEWPRAKEQESGVAQLAIKTLFSDADYRKLSGTQIRSVALQALDEIKPVVVAINGWSVPEALAALKWCRQHNAAAILMSESHDVGFKHVWLKEVVKRWRVKRFDAALVGGRQQSDYVARLGMSRDRIFLGYDAVDNEYFARGAEEARRKAEELRAQSSEVRKQCVALEYRPYFFANCRFIKRKNLDGLIRAYAKYRRQVSDPWNLVISGSGEEDARLKDLARQLGLFADPASGVRNPSSVLFPGFLQYSELPAYYGLAGAFVLPAMRESWGLVVNEAAAAGLPLIVSSVVGARYELVREGENGLLFDPGNVEELAACLQKIAGMTADARAAWADRSREIVAGFGPERFGQGLRDAIVASRPMP